MIDQTFRGWKRDFRPNKEDFDRKFVPICQKCQKSWKIFGSIIDLFSAYLKWLNFELAIWKISTRWSLFYYLFEHITFLQSISAREFTFDKISNIQKFRWKIKSLCENKSFVRKSKFCAKIEFLCENRNFVRKKLILVKHRKFVRKLNFCAKIPILYEKLLILVKNRKFVWKSNFCAKIQISCENPNYLFFQKKIFFA